MVGQSIWDATQIGSPQLAAVAGLAEQALVRDRDGICLEVSLLVGAFAARVKSLDHFH